MMIMDDISRTDAVYILRNMTDETVYASALAPIVRMHPSVIIDKARRGEWNLCKFVISGNRVKFFRKDFLQNCGLMSETEEKPSDPMAEILAELKEIRELLSNMKRPPAGSSRQRNLKGGSS